MPSPFPGMNPFLEQADVWQDFHGRFVPALGDALVALVRPHYIVKVEQHLYIHEPPAERRLFLGYGDVGISDPGNRGDKSGGTATITSPLVLHVPSVEFEKHRFLEIQDRNSRELVTVVELLSPTNKKPGADREQYLAKRGNLLHSTVHFVEIDLLRGGPRMPVEKPADCDYAVMVIRVEDRPKLNYWPLRLLDPLPLIPIPLRPPQGLVMLDIQAVLHGVYDRAGYGDYIYKDTPSPPLRPEDAAWAAALLAPK
ncbi:MAG: DUF4058 family protein [Planctomycetes bacterium]|nr:DUF4058 family protein [Planctomycetota bacterium]